MIAHHIYMYICNTYLTLFICCLHKSPCFLPTSFMGVFYDRGSEKQLYNYKKRVSKLEEELDIIKVIWRYLIDDKELNYFL